MNGKEVVEAFLSGSIVNEVHEGSPPQDVPFFVESFIPVKRMGMSSVFSTSISIRVTTRFFITRSLLITEFIIGALVLLAGGIPGYGVYRQMREAAGCQGETMFLVRTRQSDRYPQSKSAERCGKARIEYESPQQEEGRGTDDRSWIDSRTLTISFGHATGDEVLKAVAKRLRSSIPEEDSVGAVWRR